MLLAMFYAVDSYLWRQRARRARRRATRRRTGRIRIEGKLNFVLLRRHPGCVLLPGVWKTGIERSASAARRASCRASLRDAALLAIAWASWKLTPHGVRHAHHFAWGPIVEVAKLFAGIFLTIIPAIAILRAGDEGALAPVIALVTGADGRPNDALYFLLTGALSSFLDNAPTYLVFFELAGGDPDVLMGRWRRRSRRFPPVQCSWARTRTSATRQTSW